ncbi:MAG: OmpH family outer membrane protein [Bacteriovoracales bacterium]|jgi:outer membrane protein
MKIFSLFLASIFTLSTFAAPLIGKVDVQKVLLTINEGKAVRDKLKKAFEEKQQILQKDQEEIKKGEEDLKKQNLVLSDKAKEKKEKELQGKFMQLQQKTMQYQKEISDMENQFKKPIMGKLQEVITEISKNAGVDFTIEVSTTPIIYAKTDKDLTEEVIKLYDEKFK